VCAVSSLPANDTHRKHKEFQNPIYKKKTSVKPTLPKINPFPPFLSLCFQPL